MNNLIKHINKTTTISSELGQAIKTAFKEEQVAKNKWLLKEHSYVLVVRVLQTRNFL